MIKSLQDALNDQIKDLYSAENQLIKALPKMADAATSPALRQAFTKHLKETTGHVERLEQVAQIVDIKLGGKKCKAMEGLIAEGSEVLKEEGPGPVIDTLLIAAAQRVEHYEIAAYGTARAMAEQLGNKKLAKLFQQTLDEEGECDKKLTAISEGEILAQADSQSDDAMSER